MAAPGALLAPRRADDAARRGTAMRDPSSFPGFIWPARTAVRIPSTSATAVNAVIFFRQFTRLLGNFSMHFFRT